MAYPYSAPAGPVDNDTPADVGGVDVEHGHHATNHNVIRQALIDLLAELGADPAGAAASLTARLTSLDSTVAAKALAADLSAHLADTVDAHDATAVSFAPAGTIAATTVQAAIEEVATEAAGGGAVGTDAIWDAKGDLAGGTGANTASRLAVGSNGQVLSADSAEATGLKWIAAAGGGGSVGSTIERLNRTAGTLSLTASTTSKIEVSSACRLTAIPASAGDVLMASMSALVEAASGSEAIIDLATIVSGAVVNTGTGLTARTGFIYCQPAASLRQASTLFYVVQAGDISGGNVVLSLCFINSGGTGSLYATATYPLNFWALNLGQ